VTALYYGGHGANFRSSASGHLLSIMPAPTQVVVSLRSSTGLVFVVVDADGSALV
jgi:hypothetical protein